jgi:hypothetical protein
MRPFAFGRSLLGVLMVVCVPALRAQQSDSILKVQLKNGMYPANDARAILAVLADAEARRLPTDGLELRVRNGVAHSVDAQRTISDVRAYLAALIEARSTLGSAASARELENGATALAYHMPVAALRRIGSARSSLGYSLPLVVAVDLVHRGVPMDSVGLHLVELLDAHVSDVELIELTASVVRARMDGTSVLDAYRSELEAIRSAHRLPKPRLHNPAGASVH